METMQKWIPELLIGSFEASETDKYYITIYK